MNTTTKQTFYILSEYNEGMETEKIIERFPTFKEALESGKSRVYSLGLDYSSDKFRWMSRYGVWTNDPSGMQDGGLTIRKVEVEN